MLSSSSSPLIRMPNFAFLTCDVFQIHIAHHGRKAPVTFLLVLILQVDAHDGFIAYADFDIAHEDVFDDAASTVASLDAYHAVEQRAVHLAVFHVEVAVASGNLTSDDHSSVAVCIRQLRTTMFSLGVARRRPSALRPDLMAMQSSPVLNEQPSMSTFLQDSGSQPSLFGPSPLIVTLRTMRFSQNSGWMTQNGEFFRGDSFYQRGVATVEIHQLRAQGVFRGS